MVFSASVVRRAAVIAISPASSSEFSDSSRMMQGGRARKARAMAIRCCSPPEKGSPFSLTGVARPSGSCSRRPSSRDWRRIRRSSAGSGVCASATLSWTVPGRKAGLERMKKNSRLRSASVRRVTSKPPIVARPDTGTCRPSSTEMMVVLPEPESPNSPIFAPGSIAKETRSRMMSPRGLRTLTSSNSIRPQSGRGAGTGVGAAGSPGVGSTPGSWVLPVIRRSAARASLIIGHASPICDRQGKISFV